MSSYKDLMMKTLVGKGAQSIADYMFTLGKKTMISAENGPSLYKGNSAAYGMMNNYGQQPSLNNNNTLQAEGGQQPQNNGFQNMAQELENDNNSKDNKDEPNPAPMPGNSGGNKKRKDNVLDFSQRYNNKNDKKHQPNNNPAPTPGPKPF